MYKMSKDKRTGWLANVKVGDTVILVIKSYRGPSEPDIRMFPKLVAKVTPTGIMTITNRDGGNERKVKPNGSVDRTWCQDTYIIEYTTENRTIMIDSLKRARALKVIGGFKEYELLSDDELNTIVSVIEGFQRRQEQSDTE